MAPPARHPARATASLAIVAGYWIAKLHGPMWLAGLFFLLLLADFVSNAAYIVRLVRGRR